MLTAVVITFVLAYLAIVLEHPLKLDKTVPALMAGVITWLLVFVAGMQTVDAEH